MIRGDAIRLAYAETAAHFSLQMEVAGGTDSERFSELAELSRLNDYAYFILFWGQFERAIDDTAEIVADRSIDEIKFMPKAALCVGLESEYYEDLDKYYQWRCDLAHGRVSSWPEIVLPDVLDRLEEIAGAIEDGPVGGGDFERYFLAENKED